MIQIKIKRNVFVIDGTSFTEAPVPQKRENSQPSMAFEIQCFEEDEKCWRTEAEIERELPAYALARSKSLGRKVFCRLVSQDGVVVTQINPLIEHPLLH